MEVSFLKFEEKGQLLGPFLFLLVLLLPLPLSQNAQAFLAIFSWVVANWLFSSTPLFISGLFGVTLAVILGVAPAKEALAPLADPLILLFMGGFFFARAFEEVQLDRKISLTLLSHPLVRGRLDRTILAVFLLTAFISMWVSNTATTAMMLPIVMGIVKGAQIEKASRRNALLLGTAYAATIGGLGTPMGSPPNIIVIGMLQQYAGVKLNFFTWTLIAAPLTLALIFVLYAYTKRHFKDLDPRAVPVFNERPPFTPSDWLLLCIFATAVFLWFAPSFVSLVLGGDHSFSKLLEGRLDPGVVSIFFASLLFVFPIRTKKKLLTLKEAMTIDWGTLLLFGTGLSLGKMLFNVGLAELLGSWVLELFHGAPFSFFLFGVIVFTIFFTELVSNTAAANILIPLLIASSLKAGTPPLISAMACALSCNLAFMLPVGTPPNAIVYGTGLLTIKEMARSGFFMNVVSVVLLTITFYFSQFFL